jgi:hypothetical protein
MQEWVYRSTFYWPRHYLMVSGQHSNKAYMSFFDLSNPSSRTRPGGLLSLEQKLVPEAKKVSGEYNEIGA